MDTGSGNDASVGRGTPPRPVAVLLTALVALAVLSPALLARGDDFPLSPFPMFSRAVAPVGGIDTVVGLTAAGHTVRLPPEIAAGTDEVIVAGSVVTRAVAEGPGALARLCGAAASRLASDPSPLHAEVVRVEIRSETYDAIAWFKGHRSPLSVEVRAGCRVPR